MIEYELIPDPGILVIRPIDALKSEDFDKLRAATDKFIEDEGSLAGVCIQAESFPGWQNFASFMSHMQFIKEQQQRVAKVAIISESTFLEFMPKVMDHFVNAEVRHFFSDELAEAMDWLREHV